MTRSTRGRSARPRNSASLDPVRSHRLTVAIRQDERINAPALAAIFRQIIANNRAGGWRNLKVSGTHHS